MGPIGYAIIGTVFIGLLILVWYISQRGKKYNLEKLDLAENEIIDALEIRYNSIINLTSAIRTLQTAGLEKIEAEISVRNEMSDDEIVKADDSMDKAVSLLVDVASKYPEFACSEHYKRLLSQVDEAEEQLYAAIKVYNSLVDIINKTDKHVINKITGRKYEINQLDVSTEKRISDN